MERRLNEVDWTPTELSQRAEEFQTGLLEKDRLIQTLESEVEQQVKLSSHLPFTHVENACILRTFHRYFQAVWSNPRFNSSNQGKNWISSY